MKRRVALALALLVAIAAGAFFRLNNLSENVVWDSDAALYSSYARKYHEIIKTAGSAPFRRLWEEKKAAGPYVNFESFVGELKRDPRYQALTAGIEPTSRTFPDWANKPAYIVTGALFRFLTDRENSLLYLTAAFGILIVPLAFLLFSAAGRGAGASAVASILIAFSPMLVGYSRVGYSQMAALFFLVLFWTVYHKSLGAEPWGWLVAAGFFLGIAQAYHPIVLLWFFFTVLYEAILHLRKPGRLFPRLFFLALGYIPVILLLEVFQLYLWNLSLIFTGTPIRSYLHMLLLHTQHRSDFPFDPLFYVKSIALYEGVLFCIAAILALRASNRFWLFFFLFPLLFFSVFAWRLPLALRNIPFVLIPAYFLIANAVVARAKGKFLAVALVLGTLHLGYSAKVNWSNAHYGVPAREIVSFIAQHPDRQLVAAQGDLFLGNLLHRTVPDSPSGNGRHLFFYRGVSEHENDSRIVKVLSTDAFDKRMFLLEDPRGLSLFFNGDRRVPYNRVFFTFEEL